MARPGKTKSPLGLWPAGLFWGQLPRPLKSAACAAGLSRAFKRNRHFDLRALDFARDDTSIICAIEKDCAGLRVLSACNGVYAHNEARFDLARPFAIVLDSHSTTPFFGNSTISRSCAASKHAS